MDHGIPLSQHSSHHLKDTWSCHNTIFQVKTDMLSLTLLSWWPDSRCPHSHLDGSCGQKKNTPHWNTGINDQQNQITDQIDLAFASDAHMMVYWIGVIRPHWHYGVKKGDDWDTVPLIGWYHMMHDQQWFSRQFPIKSLLIPLNLTFNCSIWCSMHSMHCMMCSMCYRVGIVCPRQ